MRAQPALQDAARAELRRMTSQRGDRKRVAYELGRSESLLSRYVRGKCPIPDSLSFQILAKMRLEELLLADTIEAELLNHKPLPAEPDPDEEWVSLWPRRAIVARAGWCAQCERNVSKADAERCQSQWCKAR